MCLGGKAHFVLPNPDSRSKASLGERAVAKQESYLFLNTFGILCVGLEGHNCHGFEPLQRPLEVGPTALTLESVRLALLCTLLACPAAQLLSLLFRCSEVRQLCGPGVPRRHPPLHVRRSYQPASLLHRKPEGLCGLHRHGLSEE